MRSVNRINLLSPRYLEARARSARRRLHLASGGLALGAAGCWLVLAWLHLSSIDRAIATAEQELAPLRTQHGAISVMLEERALVDRRGATLDLLRENVPTTAVLALLTQLTGEEIDVRMLSIHVPDPVDPRGKPQPAPGPIVVTIEGHAADDVAVARYVTTLTDHHVTTNVRLEDSRKTIDAGAARNAFRISLEIPMFTSAHTNRRAGA
jgi:hypothetical protein